MPTVFKVQGFTFKFYSNENHEPAHIHIIKGDAESKWWLEPALAEEYSDGFKVQELRAIRELLKTHHHALIKAWKDHFKEQ